MLKNLYTSAGEQVSDTPWQVYPRPQLRRDSCLNLNGYWDFAVSAKETLPETFDRTILVPFCPESLLSGVNEHFPEGSFLFYRRRLTLPEGFVKDRVILHIGAADQIAEVFVNGQSVGSHVGGYEAFSFDITHCLQEDNELLIRVQDDLQNKALPYGKQTLTRGGMWYTPVSGIWQTVWLESVPANYIESLQIRVSEASATVQVIPALDGHILFENKKVPLMEGMAVLSPESPVLWSPENPHLYDFSVVAGQDRIDSYFALRTLETKVVDGIPRLCLNGKPYFFHGLLDQGYWSDGIYTPASPECYEEDILAMKKLGFNTLRKHIKVEPAQFYYDCDRLGMIVFQDMVNNGDYRFFWDTLLPTLMVQKLSDKRMHRDQATRQAFLDSMAATVRQLQNHPSICYWTIFNEGWGQFCADDAYDRLKELDDTRFIDATSGWFRRKKTDVDSRHIYFGPWGQLKKSDKPLVLSEFGGHCYPVEDHIFNPEKAYGYKSCKTLADFHRSIEKLYRKRILPAVSKGLCAAIYTQVSDVEDEINGLLTYDRKVCKADQQAMQALAVDLIQAMN
ncbi:MAG: glycoside hydrolase family 2 [Oscillospiraceae bacterium]|nr:glycoside hydrolase family 2 [Oscillospiraceae bacterium]